MVLLIIYVIAVFLNIIIFTATLLVIQDLKKNNQEELADQNYIDKGETQQTLNDWDKLLKDGYPIVICVLIGPIFTIPALYEITKIFINHIK